MHDWLRVLLKRDGDAAAAGDESTQPRLRDADGEQLAQIRAAMHDELESIDTSAALPRADLGINSTERRRALRARARKKQR